MAYTSINKPTDYFNTVLYAGNGSTQSITGVGFQPDWVWVKGRSVIAGHNLHDVVRGVNKQLYTNTTDAEETLTTLVTSFDSDGFSLGSNGNANSNTNTFVAWNWLANNTSGSSNTDGSITSTVSANTTSGFSIVSYTGNAGTTETIGHGLGAVPSVIIVKRRSTSADWMVYHKDVGNDGNLKLNTTNAKLTGITWRNTTPTSSVFTVGEDGGDYQVNNPSGGTFIAYCFAEKKGFSKFGSYIGNGSTDGTFVYTGFKPAFIITKCSSTSSSYTHWGIWDNKRDSKNQAQQQLAANISDEENSASIGGQYIDMLSNGFKTRNNGSSHNLSGETYIYMAFAESPFTTSTGVPTTAR